MFVQLGMGLTLTFREIGKVSTQLGREKDGTERSWLE
jgi:hypothetical protein